VSIEEILAWSRRLDDLTTTLTEEEWSRLRLTLRDECANHPKTDALYGLAMDCEHDVPTDDPDYSDDLHQWGEEDLLCMAKVVEYVCLCQDGYCSQDSTEARDDLWYAVSLTKRRYDRAAHLSKAVSEVWLSTSLPLEQVQDIAAECAGEVEFRRRVAEHMDDLCLDEFDLHDPSLGVTREDGTR